MATPLESGSQRKSAMGSFLAEPESGGKRILFADLKKKSVEVLSGEVAAGESLDVGDREHYL